MDSKTPLRDNQVGDSQNPVGKTVRRGKVNKNIKMTRKTVLVTGANTGIGFTTAMDLAKRGSRVIIACRSMEKGTEALEIIKRESESENVVAKHLDLASFESIRSFAADINQNEPRLDVLINNAGVMMCPQSKTVDGFEMQFGVNHLGHFLLTNLLLDLLKKSAPSRVVTVSSLASRLGAQVYWDDLNLTNTYTPTKAYQQSKLMNVLFSRELSKKLQGTGVTTYCLEPGGVKTDLQRHIGTHRNPTCMDRFWTCLVCCTRWAYKTPEQGAQTSIYCAVAPELVNVTGKFYSNCKEDGVSRNGQNDEYAKRLWEISVEYTKLNE